MYVYGVWGLQLKEAVNLSQLQTNILAGVIFSGGSFLTTLILKHASRTLRGAALLPAATGALAYALLAGLAASASAPQVVHDCPTGLHRYGPEYKQWHEEWPTQNPGHWTPATPCESLGGAYTSGAERVRTRSGHARREGAAVTRRGTHGKDAASALSV